MAAVRCLCREAANLNVGGSNPIPATTFVITPSPSRSNRRDGFVQSSEPVDKHRIALALIRGRKRLLMKSGGRPPDRFATLALSRLKQGFDSPRERHFPGQAIDF